MLCASTGTLLLPSRQRRQSEVCFYFKSLVTVKQKQTKQIIFSLHPKKFFKFFFRPRSQYLKKLGGCEIGLFFVVCFAGNLGGRGEARSRGLGDAPPAVTSPGGFVLATEVIETPGGVGYSLCCRKQLFCSYSHPPKKKKNIFLLFIS